MFKKLALISLISLGSLYGADASKPPLKKRHKISLWFKAIIPSILSCAALEGVIRAYKDNPNKSQLVAGAKYAQWLPVIIGCYCLNIWMETDLKEWFLRKEEPVLDEPSTS